AAAVLGLLFLRVPESRDRESSEGLDVAGAALVTMGLGGVVFALIESSHRGFRDPWIVGTLVLGLVALIAFVVVEARGAAPSVPLGLFRSRAFTARNLLTLLLYGAIAAALFFLPLDFIQVHGY